MRSTLSWRTMGTSLEAAREGLVVPDDDLDAEEWKEQLRAADDRKMSLEQYLNEANDRLGDLPVRFHVDNNKALARAADQGPSTAWRPCRRRRGRWRRACGPTRASGAG
ncbi:unnamed protein product, partial [Prorocentrum cordatum]